MIEVTLSNHARSRIKERQGIKGEGRIKKYTEKALNFGKDPCSFDGRLQKYLINVGEALGGNKTVKVLGDKVYLFSKENNTLITFFPIPQKLLQKRKKIYIVEEE